MNQDSLSFVLNSKKTFWLFLLLPLSLFISYLVFISVADLYWVNLVGIHELYKNKHGLALQLAEKPWAFHAVKHGFWPTLSLFMQMISVCVTCVALGTLLNLGLKMGDLVKLALFSFLPQFVVAIFMLFKILLADFPVQIRTHELNMLSFSNLFFNFSKEHPFYYLLSEQHILIFANIALLTWALRKAAQLSWWFSAVVALLAYGIYLAGRVAFIL
jgi:hypothetical protein